MTNTSISGRRTKTPNLKPPQDHRHIQLPTTVLKFFLHLSIFFSLGRYRPYSVVRTKIVVSEKPHTNANINSRVDTRVNPQNRHPQTSSEEDRTFELPTLYAGENPLPPPQTEADTDPTLVVKTTQDTVILSSRVSTSGNDTLLDGHSVVTGTARCRGVSVVGSQVTPPVGDLARQDK